MNKLTDLIVARRSIRQFQPDPIPFETIEKIVDAGRLAPSAANLQPLEFVAVDDPVLRGTVFSALKWAAYIAPEGNPSVGHEPAAYVVVLANSEIRAKGYEYDVGASMENMILAAASEGIASCWLISVDRNILRDALRIPENRVIDCVLALGRPAMESRAEILTDSVKYWKDEGGVFHVPKRTLKSVLHRNGF
jgi:nitroreductase